LATEAIVATLSLLCRRQAVRRIAALCLAASLAAGPAVAQAVPAMQVPPTGPNGMPLQEWQGVSCLWGGALAGAGVFYYSDVLTVAATGVTNPVLLIPLIATGFAAGCSVGANAAPGLMWLYRAL
jgi:hypothetical protein